MRNCVRYWVVQRRMTQRSLPLESAGTRWVTPKKGRKSRQPSRARMLKFSLGTNVAEEMDGCSTACIYMLCVCVYPHDSTVRKTTPFLLLRKTVPCSKGGYTRGGRACSEFMAFKLRYTNRSLLCTNTTFLRRDTCLSLPPPPHLRRIWCSVCMHACIPPSPI